MLDGQRMVTDVIIMSDQSAMTFYKFIAVNHLKPMDSFGKWQKWKLI